jgi:hypothetical protein
MKLTEEFALDRLSGGHRVDLPPQIRTGSSGPKKPPQLVVVSSEEKSMHVPPI